MRTITDPRDLRKAWEDEYARLSRRLVELLPPEPVTLVEIGCGRGQFTIPLATAAPAIRIIAVDRFVGPYASERQEFVRSLERAELAGRVCLLVRDGPRWLSRQRACRFSAVVSSDFLPEVTSREMSTFFRACFRVLEGGGTTGHVFLSPNAHNIGQQLTIESDSDPRWTTHPPREWFAPSPESSLLSLAKVGFADVRVQVIPGKLRFAGRAASRQLRTWGVREAFDRAYRDKLASQGLELPDWVILSGTRPPGGRRHD